MLGSSGFSISITQPQAMLVDETSDSVDTVKKEPPFAKISTGNANRTTKQKEVHPNGREEFITHLLELQMPSMEEECSVQKDTTRTRSEETKQR
jgi:hypothetical protein